VFAFSVVLLFFFHAGAQKNKEANATKYVGSEQGEGARRSEQRGARRRRSKGGAAEVEVVEVEVEANSKEAAAGGGAGLAGGGG
jgi:hypothetical protein